MNTLGAFIRITFFVMQWLEEDGSKDSEVSSKKSALFLILTYLIRNGCIG